MKTKFTIFLLLTIPLSSYSQSNSIFSKWYVGLYGGLLTEKFVDYDGVGLVELKSNLTKNIFLNLSMGYCRLNTSPKHSAIPISLGASYNIMHGHSFPYLIFNFTYNYHEDPVNVNGILKQNTLGYAFGGGIFYNMREHWKLDLRYLYNHQFDFKNLHQIIIGCGYLF